MTNTWALSALWVGLALAATLLAIWFKISTALSEIVLSTVALLVIDDRSLMGTPAANDEKPGGVMPEPEPAHEMTRRPGQLNEPQQRRLIITCKYIDSLLCEIESALHSEASESPFPRYVVDVTPAQAREIEGHIRRLRAQLLRTLDWQQMKPEPPEVEVRRLITTNLAFVDIAIEELKPKHLRGCGALPEDAVDELNAMLNDLSEVVKGMESYIRREPGTKDA